MTRRLIKVPRHAAQSLLYGGGLRGSAWVRDGRELDLLGLPSRWGEEAVSAAQRNVVDGRPTLTLPYLVVAKLISPAEPWMSPT